MNFLELKRKLGLWITHHEFIGKIAVKINLALFHWNKRQINKSFGPINPDKKFYVIRSNGKDEGLLSLYLGRLRDIDYLLNNGYIPVIDYQNYKTQYNIDSPVDGTTNAWEYYFHQPSEYTLEEVYKSKNITLSGWKFINETFPEKNITLDMFSLAPIKQYILDKAHEKINHDGINEMIGVLVRGTDYTRLRPAGHPIPPSPEIASQKLDEFLSEFPDSRIFLATEDETIYSYFFAKYGQKIYTTDTNLIINYSGQDYISSEITQKNKYQFGLDYLVKMICLSECKCLIASQTAGVNFARILNNKRYKKEYIFDLGKY